MKRRHQKAFSPAFISGTLVAVALGSTACSNTTATFGSGRSLSTLELMRNADGTTTNVDGETIYSSAEATVPSIDEAAFPDETVVQDVNARLESKDHAPSEQPPMTQSDETPAEDEAETPPAEDVAFSEDEPTKVEAPQDAAQPSAKPSEAAAPPEPSLASSQDSIEGCGQSIITEDVLKSCRESLDLGDEIKLDSFRSVSVKGKNLNNKVLFKDKVRTKVNLHF